MPKLGLGLSLLQTRVIGGVNIAITNPNFDNLTGLTNLGGGWYGGVPFGWNLETSPTDYSVRSTDGVFYANLNVVSDSESGFKTFFQNVGILTTSGTINLNFKACTLTGAAYDVGYAIYNSTTLALIANGAATVTAPTSSPQTVSLSGAVVAGTPIRISFWSPGRGAVGIRDVSITIS
jgi:hypothetical protein